VAAGTLYVVATPIGNLGDVTFRALEILRAVPLVAAEDTRVTRRLLDRYEITTRTTSYHAQSGPARERSLLEHLGAGEDLALVTDAGTPVVSDPGEGLVAAWAAQGGVVVPVPGASSVLAADRWCPAETPQRSRTPSTGGSPPTIAGARHRCSTASASSSASPGARARNACSRSIARCSTGA